MAKLLLVGKKWYSDLTVPKGRHPTTGRVTYRRIRRALSGDKKIATIKLGKLIEQFGVKPLDSPTEISWAAFKEKFLPQRPHKVTKILYLGAIRNLEEFAPNIKSPSDVTPAVLSQAKASWKEAGRGLYIVNRHIRCIKAMMRVAESWGHVQVKDWTKNREDKEPSGKLLWYTVKDLRRLLAVCKGVWKTIALIGARAGFRRSEIYWLSWDDVDFQRKRLHVSPKPEWTPKDHERRWVPMPGDVEAHLKGLKRFGNYVLMDKNERHDLEGISVYFRRLVKKAGLKGSIHTLRHSYGSHLANGGATPKVIMELMGHSSLEMVNKYLHLAPSTLQDSVRFLPKI